MADGSWHAQDGEDGVQFIEAAKMNDAGELRNLVRSDKLPYINYIVYMSGYYGEPALHVAIRQNSLECMDVLLGCSQLDMATLSDYTALEGVNALTLCVVLDRKAAFHKLLQAGASVNGVDGIGSPTIVWAVSYNRLYYVIELLCRGANVNDKTADDETPLYFAKYHKFVEMEKFLREMGAKDPFEDDDEVACSPFSRSRLITAHANARMQEKLRHLENMHNGFYESSDGEE